MSYPNSNSYTNKPPPLAPKRREQRHWSQCINETVVSTGQEDGLGVTLSGGADNGQFVWIDTIREDHLTYHSGKLHTDDILLEIQGQKVAGYTLKDANFWLKQVSQNGAPVMIKSIKIGKILTNCRHQMQEISSLKYWTLCVFNISFLIDIDPVDVKLLTFALIEDK